MTNKNLRARFKHHIVLLLLVCVTVMLTSCNTEDESDMEAYRVLDGTKTILFTNADIVTYDWDNQVITLSENALKKFPDTDQMEPVNRGMVEVYFRGNLLYEADFEQSPLSSYAPTGVVMLKMTDGIQLSNMSGAPSKTGAEYNNDLYDYLTSNGKVK